MCNTKSRSIICINIMRRININTLAGSDTKRSQAIRKKQSQAMKKNQSQAMYQLNTGAGQHHSSTRLLDGTAQAHVCD